MAAFEMPVLNDTVSTSVDHTLNQYLALTEDGTLAGVGEVGAGVLQNKPDGSTVAAAATIMRLGISRAIASAAIGQGVKVSHAASGKLRVAVTGDHVFGVAIEAAAADDDIFPVALAIGGAPLA